MDQKTWLPVVSQAQPVYSLFLYSNESTTPELEFPELLYSCFFSNLFVLTPIQLLGVVFELAALISSVPLGKSVWCIPALNVQVQI
jgi:hypothetical protein